MKINHFPVHLTIEGKTFEFEVVGTHYPQDEHQPEEFDINHLYHLKKGERYSTDFISLLDWPHVKAEVIKQLKAGEL
jgi:hypothetical protein